MKFLLDIDELEQLYDDLKRACEDIDNYKSDYTNFETTIKEVGQAKTLNNLFDHGKQFIEVLDKQKIGIEEQADVLENYLSGIEDINPHTGWGQYKIDTNEIQSLMKDIRKLLQVRLSHEIHSIESFIDDYEKDIVKFRDAENDPDLEKDYEDEPEKLSYINRRITQINSDIDDFYYNKRTYHDFLDSCKDLERALEDEEFNFDQILFKVEELEDFEESFNPGFWAKYGETIVDIAILASVVAATFLCPTLLPFIAGAEILISLARGEGLLGAALELIPFDNVLKPLIKRTGLDNVLNDALGKVINNVADKCKKGLPLKIGKAKLGCGAAK